jgi:transcriptional regulator with XRE-family HTH domain
MGEANVEREQWVEEQQHKLARVFAAVRGGEGQVHVAGRAGISRSAYDSVEKGTGNPELSTLLKAAYALKLPLGDVLLAALPDLLRDATARRNLLP